MSEPESNAVVEPNVVERAQRNLADAELTLFVAPPEEKPFADEVQIGTNT